MKKGLIVTLLLLAGVSLSAFAQGSTPPYVSSEGRSEIKVKPDNIEVNITVTRDYDDDDYYDCYCDECVAKRAEQKAQSTGLVKLEGTLTKALKSAGINPDTDLKIGQTGLKEYRKKNQIGEDASSITYNLTLKDPDTYVKMIQNLQEHRKNIRPTIQKLSHSNLKFYENQARREAVASSRENAGVLVEAAGAKLGGILYIVEYSSPYSNEDYDYDSYNYSYYDDEPLSEKAPEINLTYSVTGYFYIEQ